MSKPAFNIDILEGAVCHALQLSRALSLEAIDEFSKRFANERGRELPPRYVETTLVPNMLRWRKIYKTGKYMYALNPIFSSDSKGLDAFWVFIENMHDVDILTLLNGPCPFQLTYAKNNQLYHIAVCKNEGFLEMSQAANYEQSMFDRQRSPEFSDYKKYGLTPLPEKFIFVFDSMESMERARCTLKSPKMYCVITYTQGSRIPKLFFTTPEKLHAGK